MTTVKVQAGQSILEGYVRKASVGLTELIWNAFDEDAHLVTINCGYNDLQGLDEIVVADDGNGMNFERAERAFSRVGDSWKLLPGTRSDSGQRVVHGRQGRGRYAAYALGNVVRWTSTAEREVVPLPVELRWRSTWSSGGDHGFIMSHGSDSFGGDVRVEGGA